MILKMEIPSPGESISEVEIAQWLVSDGEYVDKDQIIAEIDSDKATLELPAEQSGVITLKAEEGDVVEVGQVVCHTLPPPYRNFVGWQIICWADYPTKGLPSTTLT